MLATSTIAAFVTAKRFRTLTSDEPGSPAGGVEVFSIERLPPGVATDFAKKSDRGEKNPADMAAMQLLHCTILTNHLYASTVEDKLGA